MYDIPSDMYCFYPISFSSPKVSQRLLPLPHFVIFAMVGRFVKIQKYPTLVGTLMGKRAEIFSRALEQKEQHPKVVVMPYSQRHSAVPPKLLPAVSARELTCVTMLSYPDQGG